VGLADSLAAIPPKYVTDKCKLRRWADSIEPTDAAALWAAVADPDLAVRTVSQIISSNGYDVSAATIQGHRNGNCRTCERHRPWV
jgi:hypothetical protein